MPSIKNKLGTYLFPVLAMAGVASVEWELDKGTKAAFDKAAYELNSAFEVYHTDLDTIKAKAKSAFDKPDAKSGLLIINLPDNYKTFPQKIGHDIYDARKEDMYKQLQSVPHTAFFALGTNNRQDSLSGLMLDEVIGIAAKSALDDINIIITGHNTTNEFAHGAFLSKNSEPEHHMGKKCLSYEGVASRISKNFKKSKKKLSVFVMPCETQSFAENTDGCNPLAQLKKVNVYCAANTGHRSNPFDALHGFEKIIALSKKQQRLLDFHQMALVLSNEITLTHGDHYHPSFCTFEEGQIRDSVNFNALQKKMRDQTFTTKERQSLEMNRPFPFSLASQIRAIETAERNPESYMTMLRENIMPTPVGAIYHDYAARFGGDKVRKAALNLRRLERR